MDDLISRQAAIDAVNSHFGFSVEEEYGSAVQEVLNALPSAQPEQQWIPCSERLPEEDSDYFVTLENGYVRILGYSTTQRTTYPKGFYYVENGISWRQTMNPVIAWMPAAETAERREE